MADRNEQIMEMVVREVERDPGVSLDALLGKAKEIDASVGELSRRQFNARYLLQAKRTRAAGEGKRGGGRTRRPGRTGQTGRTRAASTSSAPPREALRALFLDFAADFAEAESKAEIVKVLSNLDAYIGRVEKLYRA